MDRETRAPRRSRAGEAKERIYRVAVDLIEERGFEAVSIKEIVSRSGVSVGGFYHHFCSKEAVLEENFRRTDEIFRRIARDELVRGPARERIVAYLVRYAAFIVEGAGLEMAKHLYTPRNKLFVRPGRPMQAELTRILAEGLQSGELISDLSPEEACERLFIGARGLVFHWCLKEGSFDLAAAMEDHARRALRSLEPLDSEPPA